MSVDKGRTLTLLLLSVATAALTACGGGGGGNNKTPVVVPSAASLMGNYTFTAQGNEDDGAYFVAGTFAADGKGNISAGIADYNLPGGIDSAVELSGTYTIASSGSGTISLTDNAGTQDTFQILPGLKGTYFVSAFDGNGSGSLQPTLGAANPASKVYTFTLSGQGYGTAAASGNFTLNGSGNIASGMESYSDGNVSEMQNNLTGFFGTQNNNRGYAQVGGNAFSYYSQGPNQLILVGLDDRVLLYGTAVETSN